MSPKHIEASLCSTISSVNARAAVHSRFYNLVDQINTQVMTVQIAVSLDVPWSGIHSPSGLGNKPEAALRLFFKKDLKMDF